MSMFNFPDYAHDRVFKKNKNLLICVMGGTGTGKSYLSLTLGHKIDKEFSTNRVVFRSDEFLKMLNWGRLKKGNVIMFDEAGVGIPAREWQSFTNKAINLVLQTFRHRNLIVIFTVPSFNYIDKQSRNLFHIVIETKGIDYDKEICLARVKFIETNVLSGKVYTKFPRSFLSDNSSQKIKHKLFGFSKPPEHLIDKYERKKDRFARELGKELEREMIQNKRWQLEAEKTLSFDDALKAVRADPTNFQIQRRGRKQFSADLIAGKLGVGGRISWRIRNILRAEEPAPR